MRKGKDGKMEEDDTLEIIEGTLPKCSAITIVCKKQPKGAGTFHPTGKFAAGMQLFKNEETGKIKYYFCFNYLFLSFII